MVRRVALPRASNDDGLVAGIDEVGRGPWAGPVVAAAVVFNRVLPPLKITRRIDDSKKLSAATREALFEALVEYAVIGVGHASVEEVDTLNILKATHLAMRRALDALGSMPSRAVVDGNSLPALPCPATPVIGGDALVLEIAAASIIAKVTRDRLMRALAAAHPGYGWERNAGYGTAEHRDGLARFGVTTYHRRSFAPIRAFLQSS